MMSADMALMREYAQSNSEQAFATLVSKHVNLVYSVALRQVHDPHLAEEITQAVFIILVRKAKSLSPKTILSGWLCRTTRNVSADTLKIQRRRQFREREAQMQSTLNQPDSDAWQHIAPLLDEALNCLGTKEHDAVVLRFFDGKELKQVGVAMGTTEDGARMRVNRGLEKLREFFTKRGITLSATAIAGAVAANSVQAAPAGLAATITAAAFSGTTITTAAVIAATKGIVMTTLQKTLITTALAAVVGIGIYQARQAANARAEVQTLQQQQTSLTEQIHQFQSEREGLLAENSQLKSHPNDSEVLKLRGELATLRALLEDLPAARVALLKQKLEQMPEKKIPELQLLTDRDWRDAVQDENLDTDDGAREAMSKARDRAESIFMSKLHSALMKYRAANGEVLPADLFQFKPYLDVSITDEMLQRYQLLKPEKPDDDLVKLVAPYVDQDYDSDHNMTLDGYGGSRFNKVQVAIRTAAGYFKADNNGQIPESPSQITPYLKSAIDAATIQRYLKLYQEEQKQIIDNPPPPEIVTLTPALNTYKEAHKGMGPKNPSDLLPYLTTPEERSALEKLEQRHSASK
jgi:RNA polymerase sigma factor (sigma-70 family)